MSTNVPTFDLATVPEKDQARVASLIPDERIAESYVHRGIDGVDDFDLIDIAVLERENVLLSGPTGSSKTTVFRAYCASRRLPFALVECNQAMDPGVVMGRTMIDEANGLPTWVDGDMTLIVRYGGFVLFDEINMAHPRITAAYHQLLSVMRRMSIPEAGQTIIAGRGGLGSPQSVGIGAAYNPRYQGTARMNEALQNRFAIQLDWDYSREVESQLCASGSLLDLADSIRSLAEIRTPVSTNALMEFERHFSTFGQRLAETLFVNRFQPEERAAIGRSLEARRLAIGGELDGELVGDHYEAKDDATLDAELATYAESLA